MTGPPLSDPGEWRQEMLRMLNGVDLHDALDALLSLAYHEADRSWLQEFLIQCVDSDLDVQIRSLAVTCMGHVARLDRAVQSNVVAKLRMLESDPVLGGLAGDALDDVTSFVGKV